MVHDWKMEHIPRIENTADAVPAVEERLKELEVDGWEIFQIIDDGDSLVVFARKPTGS